MILKWIQKRIQNVLRVEEKPQDGSEDETCEFEEPEVKRELEKLLEFPGRMVFSRIFSDHQGEDSDFCIDPRIAEFRIRRRLQKHRLGE